MAAASEPKQVLILDSFGRDFAPWSYSAPALKTELARQLAAPVEIHEVSVEASRWDAKEVETTFVQYLRALCQPRGPDLVVPIGGQAARFWGEHRLNLFPPTPSVLAGLDQRLVRTLPPATNDVVVGFDLDLAALVEVILQVLPLTTNIAVVFGDSPLERFWVAQCRKEWAPFTNRIHFTWLNELPFDEMCRRGAALPPRSAIGYGFLAVDAAGIPHMEPETLSRLCAAANAPVFGVCEEQLGHGIIGGRLFSSSVLGRATGRIAARILQGEPPATISPPVAGIGPPTFDWRLLHRWRISERQLPPGSVVRFRQPSPWERYRWRILAVLAIMTAQAATITGLVLQRVRRRRAETSACEVSGRLITAQEEERRRIARDLHDDTNQRLALLSLELDLAARTKSPFELAAKLETMAGQVRDLSSEVHKLSSQLHPAKLDQLGLVTAARTLCSELSAQSGMRIEFTHDPITRELPAEVVLCVYRVLQEALGNTVRHSQATEARAELQMSNQHLRLTVSDNGRGFDPVQARRARRLGLLSMEERARLVRGTLAIRAEPGRGAVVKLTVPVSLPPAAPKGDA